MLQPPDTKTESSNSETYTFPASGFIDRESYKDFNIPSSMYGDFIIKQPVYSGWTCELFGMGNTITIKPQKDKVPNWFWRQMQYLWFGNKWVKNDSTKSS